MAASEEISTTPSGVQIVYQDKAHRYKLRRIRREPPPLQPSDLEDLKLRYVPSVSTVLDKAVQKNLSGWVERQTVAGVIELRQRGRPVERMGAEAILEEMKSQGLRYWNARDDAASRGTSVHKGFEQLAEGKVPKLTDFPVEHRGYLQAMCRWWVEFEPVVVHTELMVASWEHQYAGRMDLLAKVDGVLGVLDLKTSRAVRDSHHYQTAGYQIAVEESGYGVPRFGAILRAGEDGEYEYVHSLATPEQFLALHASFRAQREFDQTLRVELKKEGRAAA
jgi:genome maintenance exonuclease 1